MSTKHLFEILGLKVFTYPGKRVLANASLQFLPSVGM